MCERRYNGRRKIEGFHAIHSRTTDFRPQCGVFAALALVILAALGLYYWFVVLASGLPEGIAASNGRIEAEQVNVATKYAGRVEEVRVSGRGFCDGGPGSCVDGRCPGEGRDRSRNRRCPSGGAAKSADRRPVISQREAELDLAQRELSRAEQLSKNGALFPPNSSISGAPRPAPRKRPSRQPSPAAPPHRPPSKPPKPI